jgi:hypothetical protein
MNQLLKQWGELQKKQIRAIAMERSESADKITAAEIDRENRSIIQKIEAVSLVFLCCSIKKIRQVVFSSFFN